VTPSPMIETKGLTKRFEKRLDLAGRIAARMGANVKDEIVRAVDGVDLAVAKGEVMGLVGESGCGKSTIGRMVAGIMPATEGAILWKGKDRASLPGPERKAANLAVQMVFQDPASSLNPRLRVEDIVGEAPLYHGMVDKAGWGDYVDKTLLSVGLDPTVKKRYPHQFSGGQRQRIGIARALAVNPEFIVADESVAALDVSIRAQIINLFAELRRARDLTYLFISHDLSIVEHIADRVTVMYLGRVVESAPTRDLFKTANHPYAQSLLTSVPRIEDRKRTFHPVAGEIPSPLAPPPGCHFHPRCPFAMDRCKVERPPLKEIAPGRLSACHLNNH
jgi:oligopeptide/dipeptide ABC transporter ATP-binding protein